MRAPVDDALLLQNSLGRFEEAWRQRPFPSLSDFLPADDADRRAVLPTLAVADLRRRWQAGASAHVEVYCQFFPELESDHATILKLIAAEYEERSRKNGTPSLDEYYERFPHLIDDLLVLMRRTPTRVVPDRAEKVDADGWMTVGNADGPSRDTKDGVAGNASMSASPEVFSPSTCGRVPAVTPGRPIPGPDGQPGSTASPQGGMQDSDLFRTLTPEESGVPPAVDPTAPDMPAVAGYEMLNLLGKGGMGVVWKARHVQLKRVVALKMLLSVHSDEEQKARFRAEAEAVARLQHPNIVGIYEVGEDNSLPFISLEYVDGGSLDKKLAGKPLIARAAATLVEALARAMEEAHRNGIIHRDLKPGNILLAGGPDATVERCTPKITDFGLAKQLDDNAAHTQSGAILGTPYYMAPEQAAGKTREIGPLSDVYSLGCILYECLTGRPPFNAATMIEILEQVRNEEPVPPCRLQPSVPRDLETICLKCLEKEPRRRYASAQALADDLQCFLAGEPIRARRVRLWERVIKWARRRPAVAALIGVLLAVGLALPIAGLQVSAQLAKQRQADQKILDDARAEIHDLLKQGQTAADSQDWTRAADFVDSARDKVESNPGLADLLETVAKVRTPVKVRLEAIATFNHFVRDRDEALFLATLASGENLETNRKLARDKAYEALAAVKFSVEGKGGVTLGESFIRKEKTEITTGSYSLLLMLAEIEARRLSRQSTGEYHQQLRKALTLLDRADGLGVRTRAICLRRARYLTLLGDTAAAAREQQREKELAAHTDLDSLDRFLVGQELYSQGKLTEASEEFRRALQVDPGHFWTHYFLGICSITLGKPDVAVAHLTICQSRRPDLIWIYLLRGFAHGKLEDFTAAESDFDTAMSLKPTDATRYVLYNNRGVMRVGRKETRAGGIDDLTKATQLRPEQYEAYSSLAEAYRLDDRLEEACTYFDRAIEVAELQMKKGELSASTLALLHYTRAGLHLKRQNQEAAIRDLSKAAKLAANDPLLRARVEVGRGLVLHLQERYKEALQAYDEALKANPDRVDVHRWRGEVLLVLKRYEDAAAAFDTYLAKGGERSAAIYRQRGLARTKLNQHVEAVADYGRALEAKPTAKERAALFLYRGQEYIALEAPRPALREFTEALRLDPNSADAAIGCAHVRIKLDDPHKAIEDAERAVKFKPKEPRLWHAAARIYAQAAAQMKPQRGEAKLRVRYHERAVVLLRKAIDLVPAGERPTYLRENVLKDPGLNSIRSELAELAARFGVAGR